jgi:hypothetical protein
MNGLDNRIGRRGQKAINQMRTRNRLGFGRSDVGFAREYQRFGQGHEGNQRTASQESKTHATQSGLAWEAAHLNELLAKLATPVSKQV